MKRPREEGEVDVNLARLLMLLSSSAAEAAALQQHHHPQPNRVFECKTCSRQFPSFQALGGHRASHKKPRLSDDPAAPGPARPAKPRVHECSICGLEFSLGQALGGHMRRHRALLAGARAAPSEDAGKMRIEEEDDDAEVDGAVAFDLNMPPLENDPLLTFTLGLPLVLDAVACAARD